MLNKTWIGLLSFIVAIVMLTACGSDNNSEDNDKQEDAGQELPDPDLEGIPDIVAEINGDEITKEEFIESYEQQFQQAAMQSQLTGEEVDQDEFKGQVAEGMVGQRLLIQEANNRIPDISQEDIDVTINLIIDQNGLESKEELFAAFEEQGIEEAELMPLIEEQVRIEKLVAEEVGEIEPTDEELKETYNMIKAQQAQMNDQQEVPSFDEIKDDLIEQVKNQKEAEATRTLVDKLHENASVTIHL